MDAVGYDEAVYQQICDEFLEFSSRLSIPDIQFFPISALHGDNVVNQSTRMLWYKGASLLYNLEHVTVTSDYNRIDCRFPVQMVIRPQNTDYPDFRAYAGRVEGGVFKPGDTLMALPSGFTSKIKSIHAADKLVDEAFSPMSVEICLEDNLDISRGDMLVKPNNQPNMLQDFEMIICWMHKQKAELGKKYIIRHSTNEVRCIIKEIRYKININTLHRFENDFEIGLNDIGKIAVRCSKPLLVDTFAKNKQTGSIILIDEFTNETIAAGMIF